jgi:flavorubredoxin
VEIEMIAPSHGVIWRSKSEDILSAYRSWLEGVNSEKVVIVYDTMWGSTEKVAKFLSEGVIQEAVEVRVYSLKATHNSDIIADVLDAGAVLVGSPTLNNGVFPSVSSFLTYMNGLKPKNKIASFFGSYGWGGGAKRVVEALLIEAGFELIDSNLDFNFKPTEKELRKAFEFGREIATRVKKQ